MGFRNNIVPADAPRASNRQKYHAGVPRLVIQMAEQGKFPEEWCAEFGIAMRTLYAWANERPEFEEAVEEAWHALHAYWIRLLRENMTNAALRQTAALQVMAKRFPATWGQEPRNTLEHFTSRNVRAEHAGVASCPKCANVEAMSTEELLAELQELRERQDSI